jgi:hypothetical protein
LEGTVKLIGGLDYRYKLRGDNQDGPRPVDPERQRAALEAMLNTLSPEVLRLPNKVRELIPPRPPGYYNNRELFHRHTDPAFDPLGAAETAADLTARLLFNANRAARMVDYRARDNCYPGLGEMIDQVMGRTWKAEVKDGYDGAIQRAVNFVVLYRLLRLGADDAASNQVRAIVDYKVSELEEYLALMGREGDTEADRAMYQNGAKWIRDYRENPDRIREMTAPLEAPPGSPIGGGNGRWQIGR